MNTYVCILRGINVSGSNSIKMDALRLMFENLKFENVQTYIQSGNVVFNSKAIKNIEKIISNQIQIDFGYQVPVLIIEKKDFKNIFQNNPFIKNKIEDITKLHVTFLSGIPNIDTIEKLNQLDFGDDQFMMDGNAIYLYCPNGYGKTKLSNTYFENKFKLNATTRNWKTITELVNMMEIHP